MYIFTVLSWVDNHIHIIVPDLPPDHPKATINTSCQYTILILQTLLTLQRPTPSTIIVALQFDLMDKELIDMPSCYNKIPFRDLIDSAIPINSISAATKKMLWHQ